MKTLRRHLYAIWLVCLVLIAGCGFADKIAGIKRDPATGKVISVEDEPMVTAAGAIINGFLGPWGVVVGTLGGAALREYRHYRIIQSGAKDDDRDGKPDPEPPRSVDSQDDKIP